MSDSNVKLAVRDLNFFYGKKQVLKNLSMDVQANQILSLFGPANSGITTLLKTMNRLTDFSKNVRLEGDILLDGESIFKEKTSVIELRRRVGFVFDVPTPLPISIYDNVVYGLRLKGVHSKKKLDQKVEETLRDVVLWEEVKDRLHISGMSLSGGQQQRLCIARTLALEPEVIMLDRPCSGLDPISTAKIEDSLRVLKEKFTILIDPHNIAQARRLSDQVAFILMGELVELDEAKQIFSNPKDQRTSDYITGRFG